MATIYVRSNGNDSNGGTDPATDAVLTVQAGVDLLSPGDTLDIGAGTFSSTTTISIDAALGGATTQTPTVIQGAGVDDTTLTSATNSVAIITTDTGSGTFLLIKDLKITHTATIRGVGIQGSGLNASQMGISLTDVEIDGCSSGVADGSRLRFDVFKRVTIRNCTSHGIYVSGGVSMPELANCKLIDNAGSGVSIVTNATNVNAVLLRCVFAGNGAAGFSYDANARTGGTVRAYNCTFEGNATNGLDLPVASTGNVNAYLYGNVFWGNGGYGVSIGTKPTITGLFNLHNAYGGNTSGDHSGWFDGENKVSLTADPFTDAADEDWSPNITSGGGALLRGAAG